jgi:ketosteroid isomerase-like protein
MAHPNEELLRKGYTAFASFDLDTIRELFDDNIKWHIPGRSPVAGDYKNKDEVFDFFSKILTISEGTFKVDVHDVLANDEHAVVLTTSHAERPGKKALAIKGVASYHIKDGKVVEAWFFDEDLYADDEFWS